MILKKICAFVIRKKFNGKNCRVLFARAMKCNDFFIQISTGILGGIVEIFGAVFFGIL
jgi:hypothetical protein